MMMVVVVMVVMIMMMTMETIIMLEHPTPLRIFYRAKVLRFLLDLNDNLSF